MATQSKATTKGEKIQHVIDASGQTLGRLASQIAVLLQDKNTAAYLPRLAGKNVVVVKNASKLVVSGNKATQKVYYRHTGYMGHLREKPFKIMFKETPEIILKKAVYNMLPKNWLRQRRMNRLIVEK